MPLKTKAEKQDFCDAYYLQGVFIMNENVSTEQLPKTYLLAARIVQKHGDVYLPTFKRIHEELQTRKELDLLKDIALKIASEKAINS